MPFELFADVILTRDVGRPWTRRWGCGYGCRTPYRARHDRRRLLGRVFDMTGNTVAVIAVSASVLREPQRMF